MKKYFVKLLPIDTTWFTYFAEGNIAMGINGVCVIVGNKSKFGLQCFDSVFVNQMKDAKKAWPFICSKDIKIGDKDYELKDSFKTIGPISSDAIWVKEGMEFEESELSYVYNPGEGLGIEYISFEEKEKKKNEYKCCSIIAIYNKTCEHFH